MEMAAPKRKDLEVIIFWGRGRTGQMYNYSQEGWKRGGGLAMYIQMWTGGTGSFGR
jgi:hypothetical protein